jgi:hypothetical protein
MEASALPRRILAIHTVPAREEISIARIPGVEKRAPEAAP